MFESNLRFLKEAFISPDLFNAICMSPRISNNQSAVLVVELLDWFKTRTHVVRYLGQFSQNPEINSSTIMRLWNLKDVDVRPDIDFVLWFELFANAKLRNALTLSMRGDGSSYVALLDRSGYSVEMGAFYEMPARTVTPDLGLVRVRHYPIVVCKEFRLAA